jgi:hypothetical protein
VKKNSTEAFSSQSNSVCVLCTDLRQSMGVGTVALSKPWKYVNTVAHNLNRILFVFEQKAWLWDDFSDNESYMFHTTLRAAAKSHLRELKRHSIVAGN